MSGDHAHPCQHSTPPVSWTLLSGQTARNSQSTNRPTDWFRPRGTPILRMLCDARAMSMYNGCCSNWSALSSDFNGFGISNAGEPRYPC